MVTEERPSLLLERSVVSPGSLVVGLDEVGRGSLAGPLVVGAVVVDPWGEEPPPGLDDSKRLSALRRERLVPLLTSWCHAWSLGWVGADEIDQWGMRWALAVAAQRALESLSREPDFALVDGSFNFLRGPAAQPFCETSPPQLTFENLPARCVVKGDRVSAAIAAAAVLAKVERDEYMTALSPTFPDYGWAANKGYGSSDHMEALAATGPSPHHRLSWALPARRRP